MPKTPFAPLVAALLALTLPNLASAEEAAALEAFAQESRATVKSFAGSLQGALKGAIQEGGPAHAIPVCNLKAPEIAKGLSVEGRKVGRTSHRVRNPDNAPDAWEAGILEDFMARAAAGEDLKTMEQTAVVEGAEGPTLRYMKAIPVGEVCLACHGGEIAPEIQARLDETYPEDQATGFALGELRGAFSISKPLE